jgi:hypothetical protein
MTTFNGLRFETPPNLEGQFPYLYGPGTRWPGFTPRYWVPFRRLLRLAGRVQIFHFDDHGFVPMATRLCSFQWHKTQSEMQHSVLRVCYFCPILTKVKLCQQILVKLSNINPCSCSQAASWGETNGQTDRRCDDVLPDPGYRVVQWWNDD